MTNTSNSVALKTLGITIGLTLGAVLIVAAMHFASLFMPPGSPLQGGENRIIADLQILGIAAFGGAIADAFRCGASIFWRSWRRTTPVTFFASRVRRSPVS